MLVGRLEAIHAVGALLAGARTSTGGALLVTGEAGIGKSALLEHAREVASGFTILQATGTESERDLPFAGLAQLLQPVLGGLQTLPEPQSVALGVALALRDRGPVERFAVGAATLGVLTYAAESRPVCLLVDDAHLLDPPSQEAIAFAARRLLADKVCALAAVRTGEPSVLTTAGLPELSLPRLDQQDRQTLARAAASGPLSAEVLDQIVEMSAGNPLAVRELARDPRSLAGLPPGSAPPLSPVLGGLYARRVGDLPADTITVLVLGAVAGGDLQVMARAARDLGVDLGALAPAERAGLVTVSGDRVEATHPLARATAYSLVSSEDLRRTHAAVADALPAGDADRRAWHRGAATLGPDEEVASAIEAVGERSRGRGAYAVAATAYGRAAQLSVSAEDRARRLLAAGESAWFAGEHQRATELLNQAAAAPLQPGMATRVMVLQGLIAGRVGSLADARDLLMAAGDRASSTAPDQAMAAYAEVVVVCFYLLDIPAIKAAADAVGRLGRQASAPGVIDSRVAALATVAAGAAAVLGGMPGIEMIRGGVAYLADHPPPSSRLQSAWELIGPLFLRDSATGRGLLRRALDQRRADVAIGSLPHLLFYLARDDATTDQWPRAEGAYGEAIALARELGQHTELAASLGGLTWLWARQGRVDESRTSAKEALALAEEHGVHLSTAWVRYGLAELDLAAGRSSEATSAFRTLIEWLEERGVADVDLHPVPELVEALLRSGDAEQALAAAPGYLRRAEDKGQPWALARAWRIRGLLATPDTMDAPFGEALRHHADTVDAFEMARTQLVYGERLRRAKRKVDARAQLERALSTFERLGARAWGDVAWSELQASGQRTRRRDAGPVTDLTPRELQIALLLAEGRTTRETAGALFLSPKTVEYHLRHVYAKLGVASRAELADRLAVSSPA